MGEEVECLKFKSRHWLFVNSLLVEMLIFIDVCEACGANSDIPLFLSLSNWKKKRPGFAGLYPKGYPSGIRFVFILTSCG